MAPMSRFLLRATLAAALALVLLTPASSTARSHTAVVPDGSYGVATASGEYIYFTVRNRRVRKLEFQTEITCQASDSPTSEQRFFAAGAQAPQGRVIPANGQLTLRWWENGNGRYGHSSVELRFGARDVANIAVIVPEDTTGAAPGDSLESCSGVSSLRFRRGYEVTPPPTSP